MGRGGTRARYACGAGNPDGGGLIHRLTILVPREVDAALATLASVSGEPVDAHVHRAIEQYLDGAGRRALVAGLSRRARDRHRVALDALSDR